MTRKIKVALWIGFVAIAICVPTIVILEIIRNGNWFTIFYLVWAIGIELFILMLLGRKPKPTDMDFKQSELRVFNKDTKRKL